MLFGLAPAFHSSNVNPQESLKEGARGSGGGRHRTEGVFVALEIGLAVVLLAGAGLMIQSIWRLWRVDPGFETRHLLTAQVALSPTVGAPQQGQAAAAATQSLQGAQATSIRVAFHQMLDRVAHIPGIKAAALTSLIPLSDSDSEIGVWLGHRPQPPSDQLSEVLFYIPSPDYQRVMKIPLLKGRFFDERDTTASSPVIVIDDVMAKHMFPGQDPVGKEISMMVIGPAQIIGVVGHVKHWGLDSDDTAKIRDEMYFPFFQVPDKFMPEIVVGANLLARTEADPLGAIAAVRSQVAGPTNDQPMFGVQTMEEIISAKLAERRFTMLLLVIFAATAMVLASVGIYGVMSYSVTRRTHELGVRMALGATRGDVLKLVVREGMALAVAGMAVGIIAALGLTRLLASLLYGVRPTDPVTLAAVSVALGSVAFLASFVPARRATRVEPMNALRYE